MFRLIRNPKIIFLTMLAVLLILGCGLTANPAATDTPESATVTEVSPPATLEADPTDTDPVSGPTEPSGAAGEAGPPPELETTFQPFWQTWGLLHRYFVDQPLDANALMQGAADGLAVYDEAEALASSPVSAETAAAFSDAAETPGDLDELFAPFWMAWASAAGGDDVLRMRAALNGMIESLGDQHTSYMDPDQFIQANIPLDGTYEGIGAWVDPNDEYLTIVSPMPDSPAEAAGLRPGDQIVKIDGEDMTGIDGNLVIRRVLGPAGTEVTLTVRREGVEDFDVVIVRAQITIPSVTGEILEGSNVAYVQLFQFGETTGDDLRAVLEDLLAQNPDGLIFDLRNNGGGLLSTAVEVASEFLSDGVVLYEVYGDGSSDTLEVLGGGLATEIPLVVLINEGTASASEIVAGAIQDYGRAVLLGTTSFGKGSVQNWLPLSDEGALRVTIARWYTPNERLIHEIGLTPDVAIEITEEDFAAGLDPQLDAAVELLTQD